MAVQHLGANGLEVEKGATVGVLAQHDTYAISFTNIQLESSPDPDLATPASKAAGGASAVHAAGLSPLHPFPQAGADPTWLAQYTALQALHQQVAKATAQDPLALRRLVRSGGT